MPDYPVFDVNILLQTLAKKVGVPKFDKGGFDKISRQLRTRGNPYEIKISARYLKERVYNRLQEAIESGQPLIDISQAYIDSLSYFLGFNSFTAFQKSKNQLKEWFPNSSQPKPDGQKVLVIQQGKDREQFKGIEQLTEQMEESVLWLSPDDLTVPEQIEQASLVLWVFNKAQDLDRIESILPDDSQKKRPPFFLYSSGNDGSLQKELPLPWQQRPLLDQQTLGIALCLMQTDLEDEEDREENTDEYKEGIRLKKSGAIIGGQHKFKGKYQNVGTMNITINKNKHKP